MVPNRAKHHIIKAMVHALQLTSLKQFFAHLWTWIKIQKSKNLVLEVTKGNSGEYSGLRKNTLREKIPKYRVFFWSFFSRIQSKCVKIRTRKNSVFRHSSRSDNYYTDTWQKQPSTGVLEKSLLKICSKLAGEHQRQRAISIKLQSNFTEIALLHGCSPVNLLHIFKTSFPKNTSGWLLLTWDITFISSNM